MQPEFLEERRRSPRRAARSPLRSPRRPARRRRPRAARALLHRVEVRVVLEAVLRDVRDVHQRLERDAGAARAAAVVPSRRARSVRAGLPASRCSRMRFRSVAQPDRVLVAGLRRLLGALQAALDGLEIGQRQLGVDDLDVGTAGRSCPATCTMSSFTKQRTTCAIASVSRMCARNLLPSPSPFEAPATRPAMSTNSTVVGQHLLRLHDLGQRLEPRVRHRHHADVRVDRAERIVLGRGFCACVSALKSVDLPTFGSPTMPHLMPIEPSLRPDGRSLPRARAS